MQNRIIIGAVAGAVVFGGAFAFAAAINVTSDNLGAGQADVTSCAAATVSYDNEFEDGQYYVENVIVNAAGCASDDIGVTLTRVDIVDEVPVETVVGDGQGLANGSGVATINVDDENILAADVDKVDVVAHTGDSTSPEA